MHTIEHNVTTGQTTIVQFTTQEEIKYQARFSEYVASADIRKAAEVRQERNKKLADTDWTQVDDVPQTVKDSYVSYRQALRDIPAQSGFPWTITWPVEPQ